jgi:mannose/fructose/N-acetylgalactosamine-specific phosphotransferase system component IIC
MNPKISCLPFDLVKIIQSTHRHPVNKMLHVAGLLLYVSGFYVLISHMATQHDLHLVSLLAIWLTAIDLFIVGHVIEGNVGAMTLVILFKNIRFKLLTKSRRSISYAS